MAEKALRIFFLYFRVKWFLFQERRHIRRLFPRFWVYEEAFKRAYRFRNPFRICKAHLKQRGETDTDAYGESPLPALARIAEECGLTLDDIVVELGCGRGRGLLFLSCYIGCKGIGVDWVPFFIEQAKAISQATEPSLPVEFRCERMEETDLSEATVVYLYGTCLSDQMILELVRAFEKLLPTVKIITVSYALSDYSSQFQTLKQFSVIFPWGQGEIFLNSRGIS